MLYLFPSLFLSFLIPLSWNIFIRAAILDNGGGNKVAEWRQEVPTMLQEFEQRWEQHQTVLHKEAEARNNQVIMELKSGIKSSLW